MTTLAREAAELVDRLPPEKAQALLEYARYLVDREEEEAWESRFNGDAHYLKFSNRIAEVREEFLRGEGQPLRLELV